MPLYFAYGSNMSDAQIMQRCPSARFKSTAYLEGYSLDFTRNSTKRDCGVADIVPCEDESVWGVVFEMSEEDLHKLDRSEGVSMSPPAYRRIEVTALVNGNRPVTVHTYEVVHKAAHRILPSPEYLQLILDGANEWKLPANYIGKLKNVEVQ